MLAIDLFVTAMSWVGWIGLLFLVFLTDADGKLAVFLLGPLTVVAFGARQFNPIFYASFFPSLLIAFVVATIVAQKLYVGVAPLLGRASKLLSKDRIEKEP